MEKNSLLYLGQIKQIYKHPLQYIYVILTNNFYLHLFDVVTMKVVSQTSEPLFQSIHKQKQKKIYPIKEQKQILQPKAKKFKRLRKNNQTSQDNAEIVDNYNLNNNSNQDMKSHSSLNPLNIAKIDSIEAPLNQEDQLKNMSIAVSEQFNLGMCNSIIQNQREKEQNEVKPNQKVQENMIEEQVAVIKEQLNKIKPFCKNQLICIFGKDLNKFSLVGNSRMINCIIEKGKIKFEELQIRWRDTEKQLLISSGQVNDKYRVQILKEQIIVISNDLKPRLKNQTKLKDLKEKKVQRKNYQYESRGSMRPENYDQKLNEGTSVKTRFKSGKLNAMSKYIDQGRSESNSEDLEQQRKSFQRIHLQCSVIFAQQLHILKTWIILTTQSQIIHATISSLSVNFLSKFILTELQHNSQHIKIHLDNRLPVLAVYDLYNIVILHIDIHMAIQKLNIITIKNLSQQKYRYIKDLSFFRLGVNTSSIDRFQKDLYLVALIDNCTEKIPLEINVYSVGRFSTNLQHVVKINEAKINHIWSSQYLQNCIMYTENSKDIKMFNIVRNWASTTKNNTYEYFGSKQIISEWVSLGYRFEPLQHNQIYQQKEDEFDTMQTVNGRSQEQTKNELDDWSYSFIKQSQYWENKIKRLDFNYQFYN